MTNSGSIVIEKTKQDTSHTGLENRQPNLQQSSSESGFTLIELLVTVCIIAILAAISTTQFYFYKRNAFDAQAQEDLRNSMTAQELFYTEAETYTDCNDPLDCENKLMAFKATRNNDATPAMETFIHTSQAGGQEFNATSKHRNSTNVFSFDSTSGRVKKN